MAGVLGADLRSALIIKLISFHCICAMPFAGSVGLAVTHQPRHRSRRAELPHRAPRIIRIRVQANCD